jgi:hypothetical protein
MSVNDDERGLHADYEKWLEGLAPHAPTSHCRPRGRLHNRTGEDACGVPSRASQVPFGEHPGDRFPVPGHRTGRGGVQDEVTGCRRAPEAGSRNRLHFAGDGAGGGPRRHQRSSRLWHVGADLLR